MGKCFYGYFLNVRLRMILEMLRIRFLFVVLVLWGVVLGGKYSIDYRDFY